MHNKRFILLKHILVVSLITLLVNFFMTWLLLFFHHIFSEYIKESAVISGLSLNTTHDILINDHIYLYYSAYIVPTVVSLYLQWPLLKVIFENEPKLSIDNQVRVINLPVFLSKTVLYGWFFSIFQILMLIIFTEFPLDGFIITNLATQFTISIAAYSLTFFATDFYNKKAFVNGIINLDNDLIKKSVNTLSFNMKIKTLFYAAVLFPCAFFSVVIYFLHITNDSLFINKQYQVVFFILIIVLVLGRLITGLLIENVKHSFNALNQATHEIEKGNYDISLNITSVDELGLLMNNLNHMAYEISNLNNEILETQKEIIFTMGAIAETRSKETGNHVIRVAEYSRVFALECGLSEKEADILKQASPMHDIGKVGIPDSILNKPDRLTSEEREIMDTHAELGYEMLNNSEREILKAAAIVSYEHHEKWDGTGYPNKKSGNNIHIYGRITAIADVFDALGSKRVYKEAWSNERIFQLLRDERGKHFDPKLVDIFFEKFEKFDELRNKFSDTLTS